MKKLLVVLLAAVMVLGLCACGGKQASDTAAKSEAAAPAAEAKSEAAPAAEAKSEAASAAEAKSEAAPAEEPAAAPADDTVYNFSFASESSTDSLRYVYIEKVVMDEITERSGGRIQFTYYPSGSVAASGNMIDAIENGLCDMGIDVFTQYAGSYLYAELASAPGINLGDDMNLKFENLKKYTDAYIRPQVERVHLMAEFPTLEFYIGTTFEVNSVDDFVGKNIYTIPPYIPMFDALGSTSVNVLASEVYESFRLNVIDGGFGGLGMFNTFKLYEVCKYAYKMPASFGEQCLIMSKEKYEALPDDLKAVIDEVSDEVGQMDANMRDAIVEAIAENSAGYDFEFREFPEDVANKIIEIVTPIAENKAAQLNEAGLDGDGALAMLQSMTP